jgi:GPH family glycoside/pentoside/hexuronide:cation symporter
MNSTLTKSNKFSYGIGQTAWAAKDTCFQFFLFFYYTQLLGLSPALTGLAALLALVADAISDPIIGQISDNFRKNKWGRRHPFMIVAVIPFSLSLVAIFNPPEALSQMQLFSWFLVFAIFARTSLTFFSVPHMALGAELTDDYIERTSVAVYRSILTYFSALIIQVCAWFIFIPTAQASGNIAEGYKLVGILSAVIAFIGMTLSIIGTRKHIPNLPVTSELQQSRPWYSAFKDISSLLKQKSARVLLLGNVVMISTMGIGNTLLIHINTYFYGFSSKQMGIFMLCVLLALIPASWISMKGTRWLGKRKAIVAMIVTLSLVFPIPVVLHMYELLPPSGSSELLLIVGFVIFVHQSFFIASTITNGAMMPDIADEIALETNLRKEGMLNSAFMLTQKITFGVGIFVAGVVLNFAGFDGVVDTSKVTQDMLIKLGWVYGPGLAMICLLGAFVYSKYPLSQKKYEKIREALEKKQKETH